MQLRAQLLGHPVICGIANELVPKAERIFDREDGRAIRPNQLFAHEPRERRNLAANLDERRAPELLADHRGALGRDALA